MNFTGKILKVVSIFAKKLGRGQWSFIGPGSEKKWYFMEENSPQGISDHIAEKMKADVQFSVQRLHCPGVHSKAKDTKTVVSLCCRPRNK